MKEIWKDIVGFDGRYQVSTLGNIRSFVNCPRDKPKMLKKQMNEQGYYFVRLPVLKTVRIHRAVAEAFIPNPDHLPEVNHKDENPGNNCLDNLEWVTSKENSNYGTRNERMTASLRKLYNTRPVVQMTLQGEVIAQYGSSSEASRLTGINRGNIHSVCIGRPHCHTAGGYRWAFVET